METATRGAALELGLVAAGPDGAHRDVRVVCAADASTGELLEALADEIGLDGKPSAAGRRGRELPADAPLTELALRHGDEIHFGAAPAAAAPATVELVVVGGPEAGRRIPLLPGEHAAKGVEPRLDLLLIPTRRGAAAVACLTPRALRAGDEPADCGEVAATLRLRGVHALPLGGHMSYTHAVAAELARLDGERLAARRQLAGASMRHEQRRAAAGLSAAYSAAAGRMLRIKPTPFARPSHLALYGALRQAQRSSATLSMAAHEGDERAYAAAANRLERAEKNVAAGIRRLQRMRLP